jgi:hypothetical protein
LDFVLGFFFAFAFTFVFVWTFSGLFVPASAIGNVPVIRPVFLFAFAIVLVAALVPVFAFWLVSTIIALFAFWQFLELLLVFVDFEMCLFWICRYSRIFEICFGFSD